MWQVITGGITSLVSGWFETKQKKQQAQADYNMKELTGETGYDLQAQRNMKTSLKDEFLILIHTFMIWGYGIPSPELHKSLDNVWTKIGEAPDWWWYIYAGMVISTFGLRFMGGKLTGGRK